MDPRRLVTTITEHIFRHKLKSKISKWKIIESPPVTPKFLFLIFLFSIWNIQRLKRFCIRNFRCHSIFLCCKCLRRAMSYSSSKPFNFKKIEGRENNDAKCKRSDHRTTLRKLSPTIIAQNNTRCYWFFLNPRSPPEVWSTAKIGKFWMRFRFFARTMFEGLYSYTAPKLVWDEKFEGRQNFWFSGFPIGRQISTSRLNTLLCVHLRPIT